MKKLLFAPLICALLISCGKSEEQKKKEKIDDAEDKIERLNEISSELSTDYSVIISASSSTLYSSSDSDFGANLNRLRQSECLKGKKLLEKYISLGNDVLDVANDKGVYYADKTKLENAVDNADSILSYVTCPAHEGVNFDYDFENAVKVLEENSFFTFVENFDYTSSYDVITVINIELKDGFELTANNASKALDAMNKFISEVKSNTTASSRSDKQNIKLSLVEDQIPEMKNLITLGKINELNSKIIKGFKTAKTSGSIEDKKEILILIEEVIKHEEDLKKADSKLAEETRLEAMNSAKKQLEEAIEEQEPSIEEVPMEITTELEISEDEVNTDETRANEDTSQTGEK